MIGETAAIAFGVGVAAITSRFWARYGTPRTRSSATTSAAPAAIATRRLGIETRHRDCEAAELERDGDRDQPGCDERTDAATGSHRHERAGHAVDRAERDQVAPDDQRIAGATRERAVGD